MNNRTLSKYIMVSFLVIITTFSLFSQNTYIKSGDFLVYTVKKTMSADHFDADTIVIYLGNKENESYKKNVIDFFINKRVDFLYEIYRKEKIYFDYFSIINLHYGINFQDSISNNFMTEIRYKTPEISVIRNGSCQDKGKNILYEYKISILRINNVCLFRHKVNKHVVGCAKLMMSNCNEIIFSNKESVSSEKEDYVYYPIKW